MTSQHLSAWHIPASFPRIALWLLGCLFAATESFAQVDLDKWIWRNPLPLANSLHSVVSNGTRFVAVGTRGAIVSSDDGVTWSTRTPDTRSDLSSVVWNGAQFLAVGAGGAAMTSPDGVTWTSRPTGVSAHLKSVIWAQNQFIAVGETRTDSSSLPIVLTSPDGRTWTPRNANASTAGLTSIAWSGREFLATTVGSAPIASPDGVTWTKRGIAGRALSSLKWAGDKFVAIEEGAVLTSPDGLTWTARTTNNAGWLKSVMVTGSKHLAVGNGGRIASSVDGITWTEGSSGGFSALFDATWDGRQFVAVGIWGVIFTSPDGLRWTQRDTGIRVAWSALLALPEQTMVFGDNGSIATSVDGITWRHMRTTASTWRAAVKGGDRLVAVGDSGLIASSIDGVEWTPQQTATANAFYAVAYGSGQYVAAGSLGIVRTSRDGVTWTPGQLGTSDTIRGAAWSGARFVLVGDKAIFTAEDGVTWTRRFTATRNLPAVAWNGAQFLAVGDGGALVTSPDGLTWQESATTLAPHLTAVTWGAGAFVAVGSAGTIISSSDGVVWRAHPQIAETFVTAVAWTGASFVVAGGQGTLITAGDAPIGILTFSTHPQPQSVIAGDAASFSVSIFGTPQVRYQWRRNGTPLAGETRANLNLAAVQAADAGNYDVVASNDTTQTTSRSATLTIVPASIPSIATQPATSLFAVAGRSVTLTVDASGTPAPTYQWNRDGVPISQATNASFGFSSVQRRDAGAYSVTVTNRVGSVTSTTTTLSVEPPPTADLSRWHGRNPLPTGHSLYHVAGNGRLFVAVGEAGTIITSPDGASWTLRSSGTTKALSGVTWTGLRFVAVGAGGTVVTSSDGETWTPRASATSAALLAVAASDRQIVAVGADGAVISSPDGLTWTPRASHTTSTLNAVTWGGGLFVAVGNPDAIFTSPDGLTWTDRNYTAKVPILAVAWSGRVFVAAGPAGLVATSTDGIRWSQPLLSFTTHDITGLTWSGDRFIAVVQSGTFGTNPNRIFTSPDGQTWTAVSTIRGLNAVASAGGRHVAVGSDGTIAHTSDPASWLSNSSSLSVRPLLTIAGNGNVVVAAGGVSSGGLLLTSSDGVHWTTPATGPTTPRRGLVWGADTFVALSASAGIVTSPDGVTWTERNSGVSSQLAGIAWTGSRFVAGARDGTILTSTDAITWTPQSIRLDQLEKLTSAGDIVVGFASGALWISRDGIAWNRQANPGIAALAWNGDLYVGVGSNGLIVTSSDAMTWRTRDTGTTAFLGTIATNGRQFVAAGMSGTILTSDDGETWTRRAEETPIQLHAVAWTGDRFVAVGDKSWILGTGASRLANLSVRSLAGSDDNALVVGFVVAGGANKTLLSRGIGPGLSGFGVTGTVPDPVLTLFAGPTVLGANDDWSTAANSAQIVTTSTSLGAFPLPSGSRDAALLQSHGTGSYTARITSKNTEGVALAEIYDASPAGSARLINVSALTRAGTGSAVLIAGFVIAGDSPKRVLLRAIGPSLASFGVSNPLADPRLAVFRQDATTPLQENDNWDGSPELAAAFAATGAFTLPADSRDAALLLVLPPGAYSAQISGAGTSTGLALVEVYEVP